MTREHIAQFYAHKLENLNEIDIVQCSTFHQNWSRRKHRSALKNK